jgi:membrane protein implicated in regulation of membrane protease activity
MDINNIAYLISGFDPWLLLSLALILVLIDWMFTQTEALMALGIALIPISALNALNVAPQLQLWSYPLFILITYFSQRFLYSKLLSNTKSPYEGIDSNIGKFGSLIVSITEYKNSNYFYRYKDSIEGESSNKNQIDTILKVCLDDGQVFPAIYADKSEVSSGLEVKVVAINNGSLIVMNKN